MKSGKHLFSIICFLSLLSVSHANADEQMTSVVARATYEKIYVPAYSKVFTHEGILQPLASTVVIHNTDSKVSITVMRVDYFDRAGAHQKNLVTAPVMLEPFESASYLAPLNDQTGNSGANFLVEWTSESAVSVPAVEAVMIGGSGTRGISFVSAGRVIERLP
ncbi:DUF3124 domain-containing protein [Thioclava sp.]|uniref:DUF3124 domain-containing protein n=1 Tax=Thioclava sp. TaxID=1933450 RepID=UPI003AA811EC